MEKTLFPFSTRCSSQPSPLLNSLNGKSKKSKKLKKALDKVSRENKNLNDMIKQKNSEIASLKKSSHSLNEIINNIPYENVHCGPTAANYKLIEISNENRKLSIELVSTKSQLTKKELQIRKNQTDLQVLEQKLKRSEKIEVSPKLQNRTNIAELKNHISELNQLVMELRQQNTDLLFKLQEASKCLQQETGHTWDIDEFILNPTNWRGRAEKIRNMAQEIEQYHEQLEGYKQLLNADTARSGRKSSARRHHSEPNEAEVAPATTDATPAQNLKMFQEHNANLRTELEKEKSLVLSLKVRNEFLNEEVIKYMSLVTSLEQRTKFNNKHFSSLSELIVQQQEEYDARVAELNSQINNLKLQLDQANNHKQTLNSKLSIVETMLSEKYSCIEKLLETNKKLESDLKSFCGGFLFSCRDLRKEEFVAVLAALEAEKDSLLKRLHLVANNSKEVNSRNDKLREEIKKYQIKIAHLECQLEKVFIKKAALQRVVKCANGLKSPNQAETKKVVENEKSLQSKQSEEDDYENIQDLKASLKLAEATIAEQQQHLKRLELEQKQQSTIFEEMVSQTKETILETIRKFRTCAH